MKWPVAFLVVSLVCFASGAWSRWWQNSPQQPYYPALISGGLFFYVLAVLWPMMGK